VVPITWRIVLAVPIVALTGSAQAAPDASQQITNVLAGPNDWRAMAGLLALMWLATFGTMLAVMRGARAERKLLYEALEADTEAKIKLANAMFAHTLTLSNIQSTIGTKT
jgi:hypothetical protein